MLRPLNITSINTIKGIYHWVTILTLRELIARPSSSLTVSQTTTLEDGDRRRETREYRQEKGATRGGGKIGKEIERRVTIEQIKGSREEGERKREREREREREESEKRHYRRYTQSIKTYTEPHTEPHTRQHRVTHRATPHIEG